MSDQKPSTADISSNKIPEKLKPFDQYVEAMTSNGKLLTSHFLFMTGLLIGGLAFKNFYFAINRLNIFWLTSHKQRDRYTTRASIGIGALWLSTRFKKRGQKEI